MQNPRTFAALMTMALSLMLVLLSAAGTLDPIEGILQIPLTFLQDIFGTGTNDATNFGAELAEFSTLRQRNQELEEALAVYQSELADLRAYRNDYERLTDIVNYVGQHGLEWRYVTADVIGRDINGVTRTIHINAGTRDGVSVGDPVVTPVGLVGRIVKVSATGAEVLLITDQNSSVNAVAHNNSREKGLLRGSISGELLLDFVDINGELAEDQQLFTSGETQNFPPNLLLGQIRAVRLSQNELFKQASVVSLIDFENLELVLVITNWEPVDLQVFATPTPGP